MQGIEATFDDLSFEGGDSPQRVLPRIVPGAAALAFAGAVSVWALHWVNPSIRGGVRSVDLRVDRDAGHLEAFCRHCHRRQCACSIEAIAPAATRRGALGAGGEPRNRAPRLFRPLPTADPRTFSPAPALPPGAGAPLPPGRDAPEVSETESFPLPPARPPGFGAPTQSTTPERRAAARYRSRSSCRADRQSQRLRETVRMGALVLAGRRFRDLGAHRRHSTGGRSATGANRPPLGIGRGPLFSFPSPFGNSAPAPVSGYDHYTAVYDISARVVYLPDGTRLEAHSGLGQALDNPRYVAERAVGPTPPHVYELTLREGSFHGVQAIRLNPVGEGGIYGRAGLLAHPFMLGPNGDSNGCVSFKDYQAFLRAYENGQIKKLAVVAKL